MYITYLTDGGVNDGGLLVDAGDSDTDTNMDTDTESDTDVSDGGVSDASITCTAGSCCGSDGLVYSAEDAKLCATQTFYRCLGLCGSARVERIDAEKYCEGTSSDCIGSWEGAWNVGSDCGPNEMCTISNFGMQGNCADCGILGCDPGGEECADWT